MIVMYLFLFAYGCVHVRGGHMSITYIFDIYQHTFDCGGWQLSGHLQPKLIFGKHNEVVVFHDLQLVAIHHVLQADVLQDADALLAHTLVQWDVGETENRLRHPQLHQHGVQADGVGLFEQPGEQSTEAVVQCVLAVPKEHFVVQARHHVGGHRDAALRAVLVPAKVKVVVVSGPDFHSEIHELLNTIGTHALFHSAKVRVRGELMHQGRLDVLSRAPRHVVQDGGAEVHGGEDVALHAFRARLAVVGVDEQCGVHAHRETVSGV